MASLLLRHACQHMILGARRPIRLARGSTSLTRIAHMATPIAGRYMVT